MTIPIIISIVPFLKHLSNGKEDKQEMIDLLVTISN